MPTFYDPIELEEIDINDSVAKFYIIKLPNHGGYKFCATTQNLDSPRIRCDPVTRVTEYWPVTREQLSKANFTTLFPENKIRTAPFKTAEELNEQCHFDPPFNPNVRADHFGKSTVEQSISNPESPNGSFSYQPLINALSEYVDRSLQYDFQMEKLRLLEEARHIGCTVDQVEAIRTNVLDKLLIIDAIINQNAFSVADFRELTTKQITDIGTIALNAQSCMLALIHGRVTIEQLARLDTEALRQAVQTGDYPQSGMQLR